MARIIKLSSKKAVAQALAVLKRGGVIVFPTETSYGLGADATNKAAVNKVFRLKKMPFSKKISAMVADKSMAHRYYPTTTTVDILIDSFLPGPLTIVTKGRSFRIPAHPFCLTLTKALKEPITSTSSNISGGSDHYSIAPILKELHDVDLIIDGGKLPKRKPSTVYDVDKYLVLRKGPINERSIRAVLKRHNIL